MGSFKVLFVFTLFYLANGDVNDPVLKKTTVVPQTIAIISKATTTTAKSITTPKTTIAPTTTTTTSAPNTTTTTVKPIPTTVKPTPTPVGPSQGTWMTNYTNTNNTCLLLKAAFQVEVITKVGNVSKSIQMNVPTNANASGSCGKETETITLSWGLGDVIQFSFNKNGTKYELNTIIIIVMDTQPGSNDSQIFSLAHNTNEFSTPVSNSYKCEQKQSLNLTATPNGNYTGKLHISHFQVQAFFNSTNAKFNEALDCMGSETPDAVPIAVGCALAALVIVVLVAYLIGRRRSQARGYLSM